MKAPLERLSPFGIRLNALSGTPPPMAELVHLLLLHKLVLVRGVDFTKESFLGFCRSLNPEQDPCLHWDFGPLMELSPAVNPQNYLFSREAVPFHWDGAFYQVPSALVFYSPITQAEGSGGETLFSDGERMYRSLTDRQRKRWSQVTLQYETEKKAHYGGKATTPLFVRHPKKGTPILRYAERVETELNPVSLEIKGLPENAAIDLEHFLNLKLYSTENSLSHRWEKGDLLLADNHSLLHGRRALAKDVPRQLLRVQLK